MDLVWPKCVSEFFYVMDFSVEISIIFVKVSENIFWSEIGNILKQSGILC